MSEQYSIRWVDCDTILLIARINARESELATAELPFTRDMLPHRLREFAAGRCAARQALATLGESPAAIPIGAGGEPLWPVGIVGSISHTTTHVAVLISRRARYASVGVDLDDERPLGEAAAADLMSGEEIELIQEIAWAGERSDALNVVFCAKEALFKCQYPLSGSLDLDFEEVRLARSREPGMLGVTTGSETHGVRAVLETIDLQFFVVQSLRLVLAFAAPAIGR